MNKRIPTVMKSFLSMFLATLFAVQPVSLIFGQVKFTAVCVNNKIDKNEYLEVKYIVENVSSVDQIVPPAFKNFLVVSGPNQQSSMTITNNQVKQYIALEFILKPKTQGRFTLPPATATVNGNTFRSNSLSITVSNNVSSNPRGGTTLSTFGIGSRNMLPEAPEKGFDDYILHKGEDIGKKIKANLFIKVEVSKTTCYVGEPILASYKLYTRVKSESNLTKSPSFNGFSVNEIELPDSAPGTEKINGKEYSVYTLRKAQLYPLQAGKVELEPIEVENEVTFLKEAYAGNKTGDMFDEMFKNYADARTPQYGTETQKITLKSKSLGIIVKELPKQGLPKDFKGTVGAFGMHLAAQKDPITTDESGNLSLVISGSGNLQMINAPKIPWPAAIEAFDPVATEKIDYTAVPLKGQKVFNYAFAAAKPGKYTIPAITFSYFDIAAEQYKTLSTAPQTITVQKGKRINTAVASLSNTLKRHTSQTFRDTLYNWPWLFLIVAVIVTAGIVILRKKSERYRKIIPDTSPESPLDSGETTEGKEDELYPLRSPLLEAEQLLSQNNATAFYHTLNNCLKKYLSVKLKFPEMELSKKKMSELLDRHHVGLGTTLMLSSLLEKIELNLYAPHSPASELQEVYEKASEVVSLLDKQIS